MPVPRTTLALALSLSLVAPAAGPLVAPLAAQPADTTGISTKPLFTSRDLWVLGGFAAGTALSWPLDRWAAQRLQTPHNQENRFLRHTATALRLVGQPGSLIIGTSMYAVGKLARNEKLADLGFHGTEALLVGSTTATIIKTLAGRARPYVDVEDPRSFALGRGRSKDDFRSFPSGHSVAGFAAAAAVTSETSRWWPSSTWYVAPVMYGGAALIAVSRMYNNKHWASDVMVGAAIGTFAGRKVVQYHHSHPGNKLDKWFLGASVVPMGSGYALQWSIIPR